MFSKWDKEGKTKKEIDNEWNEFSDINADGSINIIDVVITVNVILLIEPLTEDLVFSADLNSTNTVTEVMAVADSSFVNFKSEKLSLLSIKPTILAM